MQIRSFKFYVEFSKLSDMFYFELLPGQKTVITSVTITEYPAFNMNVVSTDTPFGIINDNPPCRPFPMNTVLVCKEEHA